MNFEKTLTLDVNLEDFDYSRHPGGEKLEPRFPTVFNNLRCFFMETKKGLESFRI